MNMTDNEIENQLIWIDIAFPLRGRWGSCIHLREYRLNLQTTLHKVWESWSSGIRKGLYK